MPARRLLEWGIARPPRCPLSWIVGELIRKSQLGHSRRGPGTKGRPGLSFLSWCCRNDEPGAPWLPFLFLPLSRQSYRHLVLDLNSLKPLGLRPYRRANSANHLADLRRVDRSCAPPSPVILGTMALGKPRSGAEGIRTPGLLIANETRYQLRHSPLHQCRLAGTTR